VGRPFLRSQNLRQLRHQPAKGWNRRDRHRHRMIRRRYRRHCHLARLLIGDVLELLLMELLGEFQILLGLSLAGRIGLVGEFLDLCSTCFSKRRFSIDVRSPFC
jgi:hypothetical protein